MILFRIALRNILATKARTTIIGFLVLFGTVLVVLGGSLLSTLELSMAKSIIGSVSGHFQVYSKDAKDTLEFFAPPTGTPNLGRIEDFKKVQDVLEALDEVEAVVPMGNDFAIVFGGNIMDAKLAELREAVASGNDERKSVVANHIRRIIVLLREQMDNLEGFVNKEELEDDDTSGALADMERASSDEFWQEFEEDPEPAIVFIENKLAKYAMDESMLFLRYIGTDTEAFSKNFELFEVVKGGPIPAGKRGFLFSDFMYERMVKHQVAKRLDRIKEWLDAGKTIADDKSVSTRIEMNVRQYKDILYHLDLPATEAVAASLRELLGSEETDPVVLLKAFLGMDDSNFHARYDFFYEKIAPSIVLYSVKVGDTLTIRAFTRSGYSTSVNVPVYGTYRFRGMEKSALSGVYNLMDLMTYRDLYGHLTDANKEELDELIEAAGVEELGRESAEAAMFGEDAELVVEEESSGFDEFEGIDMKAGGLRFTEMILNKTYTQDEILTGITSNAAIRLKEGVSLSAGRTAIEGAIEANELGLQVLDWKEASGLVGQFIGVIWVVLVTAILIIFLVALVIINNSMVMATLDRTREIGTMRAIGAQRGYVLKMFLIESSVLGLGFGILGVLLGAGLVLTLGHFGIPAMADELYFIFGGPRLYPILTPGHLAMAFAVVFLVSVASTIYPALLATRILPVKAMGKED